MPYIQIKDFRRGLDARRDPIALEPGALQRAVNCQISRGGDIERKTPFRISDRLPPGTKGLAQLNNQKIVFGITRRPASLDRAIGYIQCVHPSDATLNIQKILEVANFAGQVYSVIQFEDQSIYHYYNGVRESTVENRISQEDAKKILARKVVNVLSGDPDVHGVSDGNSVFVIGRQTNTSFTWASAKVDRGAKRFRLTDTHVQDPTAAGAIATDASIAFSPSVFKGRNEFRFLGFYHARVWSRTRVFVDGIEVSARITVAALQPADRFPLPAKWLYAPPTTDDIVADVNAGTGMHGFTASNVNGDVVISAPPDSGALFNGISVTYETAHMRSNNPNPAGPFNVGVATDALGILSGGSGGADAQAQIERITFDGTMEATDAFTLTINGRVYDIGCALGMVPDNIYSFLGRLWCHVGPFLIYSALGGTSYTAAGAGILTITGDEEGPRDIVAITRYQGQFAILTDLFAQIWTFDTDPANFLNERTLPKLYAFSRRTAKAYGTIDVFHLTQSGLRSLRPRDSSGAPTIEDVGTPVDDLVVPALENLDPEDTYSFIEPISGRYFLILGSQAFVFSRFPGNKIGAWTQWELPQQFDHFVVTRSEVLARAGDNIHTLAGDPAENEDITDIITPFLDIDAPATNKSLVGIDVGCRGTWDISLLVDPDDPSQAIPLGSITNSTYWKPRVPVEIGELTHFALQAVCRAAGAAKMISMAVHYETQDTG